MDKTERMIVFIFVILGFVICLLLEDNMLSNFIDNMLQIPLDERHN